MMLPEHVRPSGGEGSQKCTLITVTKQRAKVAGMAFAGILGGCWVFSRTTHARAYTNTERATSKNEEASVE